MIEDPTPTYYERERQFEDRWTGFGEEAGLLHLSDRPSPDKLKKFDIFQDYEDEFLSDISKDVTIAEWDKHTVLFEEGSYIDLAFYIVEGSVEIFIQKQQEQKLHTRPIFDSYTNKTYGPRPISSLPEGGDSEITVYQTQIKKQPKQDNRMTFLTTMDVDLISFGETITLGQGEIFGEIGVSIGWPQSVTARTATKCTLVQIRVPALKEMKRKSPSFKQRLNKLYMERSLLNQLKTIQLFQHCSDAFLEGLKDKVELPDTYKKDKIITREGEPIDAIYLIRSGFVKLLQKVEQGEIVVNYLPKGSLLGEVELMVNEGDDWLYTARSVAETEVVRIPLDVFKLLIKESTQLKELLWKSSVSRLKEAGQSKRNIARSEFLKTAIEKGLVEGNSILVIDLDLCTRCDDCVRGCADTHEGQARFIREGEKYNNFLITTACYHCEDPLCLIGCPTGAIRRAGIEYGRVVEIDDDLCIGCQNCAQSCPYSAITMIKTGTRWPDNQAIDERYRGAERLLATKCDLCFDKSHDPACVTNCPHGCAVRVETIEEFNQLLSRTE